jgi:hypothetical protein
LPYSDHTSVSFPDRAVSDVPVKLTGLAVSPWARYIKLVVKGAELAMVVVSVERGCATQVLEELSE